ncbi:MULTISPECIES: hypothetical protein [Lactobacillus]|uniref:hypothetical protein n=1 Tax=Lactobacillus TaxID=1578 RepID=UPI000CD931C3|nr:MULTISPECIES: hypothetical protein [Lactobacillus]RVU72069.1 hypothetical protein EJK20_11010 [Lactobacillus xujianguonis]
MNKKVLKALGACSLILASVVPATNFVNEPAVTYAASKQKQESVKMLAYKDSKNHTGRKVSMARGFIGTKATLVIKNGQVKKMIVHVDGKNSPMGKGQNVNKIVKGLKINGVKGKKANISKDNSSFDFVFSGKAFKNNGWVRMSVTINFGAKMTESAWIKYGKAKSVKKNVKTSKKVKSTKKVSKKSSK